jgi:hypothetical protein
MSVFFPLVVAISNYNMIHRCILSVETNVIEFFIFQRTSGPRFDIKLFFLAGSLSPGSSLVLQISKLVVSILMLFLKNSRTSGPDLKIELSSIYTLHTIQR